MATRSSKKSIQVKSKNALVLAQSIPSKTKPEENSILTVISRAAADPNTDVEKLERLLAMAERVRANDAKAAYIKALVKMKPKLPVIDKRGRIEVREKTATGKRDGEITQNTPYALWEDIDEAITPILAEHGFVLTHRCGTAPDGKILITGVLSHEMGHSEETTMSLPHDSSGSKNAVQAIGSSTQYGKRYTAGLLLNLRTKGLDDDGKRGGDPGFVSDEQAERILEILTRDKADVQLFCKSMKIASIIELPAARYEEAIIRINTRSQVVKQKENTQP